MPSARDDLDWLERPTRLCNVGFLLQSSHAATDRGKSLGVGVRIHIHRPKHPTMLVPTGFALSLGLGSSPETRAATPGARLEGRSRSGSPIPSEVQNGIHNHEASRITDHLVDYRILQPPDPVDLDHHLVTRP